MSPISIDVDTLTTIVLILYACFFVDIFLLKDEEDEHAENLGDNPNVAKELVENTPKKEVPCNP